VGLVGCWKGLQAFEAACAIEATTAVDGIHGSRVEAARLDRADMTAPFADNPLRII